MLQANSPSTPRRHTAGGHSQIVFGTHDEPNLSSYRSMSITSVKPGFAGNVYAPPSEGRSVRRARDRGSDIFHLRGADEGSAFEKRFESFSATPRESFTPVKKGDRMASDIFHLAPTSAFKNEGRNNSRGGSGIFGTMDGYSQRGEPNTYSHQKEVAYDSAIPDDSVSYSPSTSSANRRRNPYALEQQTQPGGRSSAYTPAAADDYARHESPISSVHHGSYAPADDYETAEPNYTTTTTASGRTYSAPKQEHINYSMNNPISQSPYCYTPTSVRTPYATSVSDLAATPSSLRGTRRHYNRSSTSDIFNLVGTAPAGGAGGGFWDVPRAAEARTSGLTSDELNRMKGGRGSARSQEDLGGAGFHY